MRLDLTERESELLRELLHDYLPSLQREVARTDKHALRHELVERQNLIERLIGQLPAPTH